MILDFRCHIAQLGRKGQFLYSEWSLYLFLCMWVFVLMVGNSFGEENVLNKISEGRGQRHFVYDDHGKRDPFLPLVDSNGIIITYEDNLLLTDLVLEGIVLGVDDNANLAIINGKVLKKGDKIGPFVVLHISAKSVLLGKGKQKFDLKLKKGE